MKKVKGIYDDQKLLDFLGFLALKNPPLHICAIFTLLTGLRISDVLKLKKNHFATPRGIREAKTGKLKAWSIPPNLLPDFDAHADTLKTDLVFPFSRQTVHKWLKRAGKAVGLPDIGPHSLRKTYAWNVLRVSGCVYTVQAALNHKYISTTVLYLIDGISWALDKAYRHQPPPIPPSFQPLGPDQSAHPRRA